GTLTPSIRTPAASAMCPVLIAGACAALLLTGCALAGTPGRRAHAGRRPNPLLRPWPTATVTADELLGEASEVLGPSTMKETVNRALSEVVHAAPWAGCVAWRVASSVVGPLQAGRT